MITGDRDTDTVLNVAMGRDRMATFDYMGKRVQVGDEIGVVRAQGRDAFRGEWLVIDVEGGRSIDVSEYDRTPRPLFDQVMLLDHEPTLDREIAGALGEDVRPPTH